MGYTVVPPLVRSLPQGHPSYQARFKKDCDSKILLNCPHQEIPPLVRSHVHRRRGGLIGGVQLDCITWLIYYLFSCSIDCAVIYVVFIFYFVYIHLRHLMDTKLLHSSLFTMLAVKIILCFLTVPHGNAYTCPYVCTFSCHHVIIQIWLMLLRVKRR